MTANAVRSSGPTSHFEQLHLAREILRTEGNAVLSLVERLDGDFCRAVDLIHSCTGSVIVIGMGKAGLIGQKITATLCSTGTRSQFLHPAEAVHGDMGCIDKNDVVLMLSHSGESDEMVRLLPSLVEFGVPIVAITGNPHSTMATSATIILNLGKLQEACPLGLAPSTTTTAMLAMGDAVALVVSRMRNFGPPDFARCHPAGSLGLKLTKVEEIMRPLDACRQAPQSNSVREILVDTSRPGRRAGAILLTDDEGKLSGIFTDSDLVRLLETNQDAALDAPVRDVMTAAPTAVRAGTLLPEAVSVLADRKISELPVVDDAGRPLGLIDVTDVLAMMPQDARRHLDGSSPSVPSPAPPTAGTKPATLPFSPDAAKS